jgi:hypothetical protein|tara:strand:+ start:2653 stop:3243 length:591 start_codon:yes stop_codon:yes gene_type:complete
MWALIKDNKIETMYRFPKSIILNEVRYPSNMFTLYTASEKEALGIYPVLDTGTKGDDRFENTDGPAYTFDAGNKRVTTAYTITERKLDDTTTSEKDYKGNDIVNLGLKSEAKKKATITAHSLLNRFNWLIVRNITASVAIPDIVKTYMAAIRTDHKTICDAIDNASDMTAFKKLYSDGTIEKWSDDYDVKDYIRKI